MRMRKWLWQTSPVAVSRLLSVTAFAAMALILGACSALGSGGGLWRASSGSSEDSLSSTGLAVAGGANKYDAATTAALGPSSSRMRAGHDNTPDTANVVPKRRLHCLNVDAVDLSHTFERLATHYGLRMEWLPEDDRRIVQPYKIRFDCFEEALRQLLLMNPLLVADIYYPNRVVVVRDADRHTKIDKSPLRCATSPVRLERSLPACRGERLGNAAAPPSAASQRGLSRAERSRMSREEQRHLRAQQRDAEKSESRSRRATRKQWAVRVAVYDSGAGAQRMLDRLLAAKFTAYLAEVQHGSRTFSGLYVGRDLSKRQAARLSKDLDRRYGLATLVVRRAEPPTSAPESPQEAAASPAPAGDGR